MWSADGVKTSIDDLLVVANGPGRVLGDFDDNGIAGEERGRHGVEHVMEGIVPRHDGACHCCQ